MSKPSILTKGGNIELVERLQRLGVKFLVVGGAAVFVHGCREVHEVDDLDFLIEPSLENCARVILALNQSMLNIPFSAERMARPQVQLPVKHLHFYAELLTPEIGVDFSELECKSVSASLSHLEVQVLGLHDLTAMKARVVAKNEKGHEKHRRDLDCLRGKVGAS